MKVTGCTFYCFIISIVIITNIVLSRNNFNIEDGIIQERIFDTVAKLFLTQSTLGLLIYTRSKAA